MTKDEETVYEFCRELRETQSVSDATYESALASIGEQGIIDLIGVIGYYTWMAMLMNVARNRFPEAPLG
jgi:4-carboxymuconolactone decarboxylase